MDKRIGKRHWLVKNLTWVEDKGWEGIVYAYVLDAPNDKKNGWMYIGCTPEERIRHQSWSRTGNKYAGKKIADARKKYGTGSFSFIVLERHHDPNIDKLVEKLEERETAYINRFDTVKNGFNACRGGTGRRGQKISQNEIDRRNRRRRINGFKQSDEAKRKISLASSKRKKSQEEKDKISRANKGKKRTPEMRKAQSDRMKGKVLDFGCGYGPIGIYLARNPELEVYMIDINRRSLELARKNVNLNHVNVTIYESDIYSNVHCKFDYS